jgi:hypothetical protein
MSAVFLIVVYCLHVDRCYVSKDAEPHKYETTQACELAIRPTEAALPTLPIKEPHKNSVCVAVTDVSCVNGGSVCTFTPADPKAADMLKNMVTIPK